MSNKKLTKQQKESLKTDIQREIYKRSFYDFLIDAVKELEPSTNWEFNWHIKYLCDTVQNDIHRIIRGEEKDKDRIINVPPRTMKSYIFSICLNAWAWTHSPWLKFMTISYADNLSSKFSYRTRLLIQGDWYQKYFGDVFSLSDDDNRKTSYSNSAKGTRESFGMSGSVTGSGADIIIIDDPQKPSDISQTKLDNAIDIYRDTIFNRLNDPLTGLRIIVQQRTNEMDLTGYLMSTDSEQYDLICLPMELTKDVYPPELGKHYKGGLLWEERFPSKILIPYQKNQWTYSTQYLQSPTPLEGDVIKRSWFEVIDKRKISDEDFNKIKWELIIDSAYTDNKENDETGILIVGKWGNNLLIKKTYILYLEFPDLIKKLKIIYKTEGVSIIRIEPKASGLSILQQLKREGFNVTKTPTPKDDKLTRVISITNVLEGGRVYLLYNTGENLLLQQCAAFPKSNKDGLVDCLYYAVEHNLNKGGLRYGIA